MPGKCIKFGSNSPSSTISSTYYAKNIINSVCFNSKNIFFT